MLNSDATAGVRFDELATLVETKGTAALEAELATRPGGVPGTLDAALEVLASGVDPVKNKRANGVFNFEISTAGGVRAYVLEITDGTAVARRGGADKPDVTLGIALADVVDMVAGNLSGQQAFLTGKLSVRGNALMGMKLGKWLQHK